MTPRRQAQFDIPGSFIAATAIPLVGEIAWGFREGWITPSAVVQVELAKLEAGLELDDLEERLALLLSDEYDSVLDLLSAVPIEDATERSAAEYWLFMALAWLLENRESFEDPLELVELLYSDFGYPADIEGLVRYMPPEFGQPTGLAAIDRRWIDYVDRKKAAYAERVESLKQ